MKVEPVMMGLRKVRSEVTTVRKEGVVLNGTEKVNILTVDGIVRHKYTPVTGESA